MTQQVEPQSPSRGSASLRCGLQGHRARAHCIQEARILAAVMGKQHMSPVSRVSKGEVEGDDIDVILG